MKYILSLMILLSSCQLFYDDTNFKDFVLNQMKNKERGYIHIDKFNAVNWDKMYIITAYCIARNFDKTVLPYKDEILKTGIGNYDNFVLVLLFKNEKMVNMTEFSTSEASLSVLKKISKDGIFTYYKKNEAVFKYYWEKSNSDGSGKVLYVEHVN